MKSGLRLLFAIAVLALFTVGVIAGAGASKTETVQYPAVAGTESLSGFLASPAKAGRYPGLIVVHEWWGLNDWVKEQAQKFADNGYITLAPDLYRGKVATDPAEAHELMRGLPQDRAILDLQSAFVYLYKRNDVDHDRIGIVGWCMGGGLALQLAIHQPHLAACVVNYGALPTDPNDIQQILAPVLGNFGANDRGITPTDVHAFEKAMKNMNRKVDVKIYDGAGHAFENPNNKDGYRPEAAADAWQRTITFLNKALH